MYSCNFNNGCFLLNDHGHYEFFGNRKQDLARYPKYSNCQIADKKITFGYQEPSPSQVKQLETYLKQIFYPNTSQYVYFLNHCCNVIFQNSTEKLFFDVFEGMEDLLQALSIWTKDTYELLTPILVYRIIEKYPWEYGVKIHGEYMRYRTSELIKNSEIIDVMSVSAKFNYHAPKSETEQYETRHYSDICSRKFALEHRSTFFYLLVRHQNLVLQRLNNYYEMSITSDYYFYYLPKDLIFYTKQFILDGLIDQP